jgi:hypothetical protein
MLPFQRGPRADAWAVAQAFCVPVSASTQKNTGRNACATNARRRFCDKLNPGMQSGWIRAFVFSVAALLLNGQCYGNCSTIACGSAPTPSNSCHQDQKSSHDDNRCPHQHSEFASPEVGIAKVCPAMGNISGPALAVCSTAVFAESQFLTPSNTSSPPCGDISFSISVLRI